MTPAEHRAQAERLVALVFHEDSSLGAHEETGLLSAAQVHATLALAPAATPPPPTRPKPPARVEVLDVELNHLAVYASNPLGGIVLHHPATDWSTLLDDPAQVRLLADTLTAHADRMENRA